jgi:hypothetical protein
MAQLTSITLDDGTVIYLEASDDLTDLPAPSTESTEEQSLMPKGINNQVAKQFQAMQGMIRSYTSYTLNAFRQMAGANVDKVTLEFGIKVAGEAGLPYVTKGSADANLKVTVECSFPK